MYSYVGRTNSKWIQMKCMGDDLHLQRLDHCKLLIHAVKKNALRS